MGDAKEMSIIEFVNTMIGLDLLEMEEYKHIVVAVASCILIIMFSTVFTLLHVIGGLFAPRRY